MRLNYSAPPSHKINIHKNLYSKLKRSDVNCKINCLGTNVLFVKSKYCQYNEVVKKVKELEKQYDISPLEGTI